MAADARQLASRLRSRRVRDASASLDRELERGRARDASLRARRGVCVRRGASSCRSSTRSARQRARARAGAARRCCTGSRASATSRPPLPRRVAFESGRARRPPPRRCSRRSTRRGSASSPTRTASAALPRPRFARRRPAPPTQLHGAAPAQPRASSRRACSCRWAAARTRPWRSRSCAAPGCELALFSVGDAPPIARTVAARGCRGCSRGAASTRELAALNERGRAQRPRPGHRDRLVRGAADAPRCTASTRWRWPTSAPPRAATCSWDGVEVNHQFSKGLRAERLLSAAVAELAPGLQRVLGPAPRLGARDRARVRAPGALPRRVHELQRDLPHRPRAARRLVVLRVPEVPVRVPRARARSARPEHLREVFGARPARRGASSSRASRC